jgi:hypothetical protein
MKLLSISNTKTVKGEIVGYSTAILHLAPHKLSGYNVCPKASIGCAAACLNTAGRGRFSTVQVARIRKTKEFFENRIEFMRLLEKDIYLHVNSAIRKGMIPCIRLNGTSDIPWERIVIRDGKNIMQLFGDIQFYDYTKRTGRQILPNYHLTFSLAEDNHDAAQSELARGLNVAVVFRQPPELFWNHPVVDGDETDLRFLDPQNCIVGLKAKGKAKKDTSGFVI